MTQPFDVCEWYRTGILDALASANSDKISTSYTGLGVVAWDDICGSLVVVPTRIFESLTFPDEATATEVAQCQPDMMVIEMAILLLRCVPTPNDKGRPPPPAKMSAAHQSALEDGAIILDFVTKQLPPPDMEWERTGAAQIQGGADGGAIGIETLFMIGVSKAVWGC